MYFCYRKFFFISLLIFTTSQSFPQTSDLKFSIAFNKELSEEALDGRLLFMIASDSAEEPRFQIKDDYKSQQIFGIDVVFKFLCIQF